MVHYLLKKKNIMPILSIDLATLKGTMKDITETNKFSANDATLI